MTQKPLLWVEVGALAMRKRSECTGEPQSLLAGSIFFAFSILSLEAIQCFNVLVGQARVLHVACVCVVFEAFLGCLASSAFLVWCSLAGIGTADF
jgi:hypothetical protein